MSNWVVADWHIGEQRLAIMGRDIFKSSEEMVDHMVRMHNDHKGVKKSDVVYVVGDALFRDADPEKNLKHIERFNGRKVLIRGNHDKPFSDKQLTPYFEEIVPEGEGIDVTIEGIPCYITHYPTQGKMTKFNIVGHIHGAWKYQLNMVNIGVDANHFCPTNFEDIPKHLKAITEFYDEDVWVGYNNINKIHRSDRGKKSRYFNG